MKTTSLFTGFLTLIFFLLALSPSHAETITTGDSTTTVNITNTTGGNSVTVTGDGSTSVVSESNTTSRSDVRIEQNGEVKEFHSTGESIDYTSDDGSVKVKIDNNTSSQPTSTPVPVSDESAEEVLGDEDQRIVEENEPSPVTPKSLDMDAGSLLVNFLSVSLNPISPALDLATFINTLRISI